MSSLDSFFASIQLPLISAVAQDLIQTLNLPAVSVAQVRDIIAKDPALSANLLRAANSAEFGLPRGVGTIDDAIAMVGLSRVRAMAVGACLSGSFTVLPGLDRKAFWQSSMRCAGYAQWLAAGLGIDSQMAWLTGMMLRLGELLIAQVEPNSLQVIEQLPQPPGERWLREKQLVGFSEGQITAELARRWNFPMQIVQALQRASDPLLEQAYSRLGAVVHLAGLLADMPAVDAQALAQLPDEVIDSLHLDLDWLRDNFPAHENFVDIVSP